MHVFDSREKIALFIDGANLYATSRNLGFDIDYKKLLVAFQKRGYLLRAYYYTALVEDQEYSSIRPLVDWLDYNGYRVITKAAKEFTDATGRRRVKGNMDIELAIDALELAPHIDHMVLFSGDGDFRSLVEAMQRREVERLAADTGAVVLVRGHSRTLLPGSDIRGARVVDVTAYPDVSDLLLAADALVTDYSSLMFDFTATGKPIFFFTPDLEHYREDLRGFYFDLAAHAPGPLRTTQEDLTDALVADGFAQIPAEYTDRYRRWQEQFNARDDGHASERVVARILDQGFVDRDGSTR